MYVCDDRCYDYGNGHICKHVHRVHSLQRVENSEVHPDCHPLQIYFPPVEKEPITEGAISQGNSANIIHINKVAMY